ncbi:MAG: CAP domain-containing protein [Desulfobulbaceae bacterium]|nr:CAP domain-containing protein [Desulfobulbaceae bacterium]
MLIYFKIRPTALACSLLVIMVLSLTLPTLAEDAPLNRRAIVQAHNKWRAEVNSPDISWSAELADKASNWAKSLRQKNCALRHSGPGQNLYWASPQKSANSKDKKGNWIWRIKAQNVSEKDVVDSWATEKKWYNSAKNSCYAPTGRSCGHYTQLIWSDSTEVGCSFALCDDQSQIWVCNYHPAGNIVGQKPF